MADKRRAEQNKRWLMNFIQRLTEAQQVAVDELSMLDKDRPAVAWDRLDDTMKRAHATILYATQNDKQTTPS